MLPRGVRATRSRKRRRKRAVVLSAAYVEAPGGGYSARIPGGVGTATQGDTLEEARANVLDVIGILLEEAPEQLVDHEEEPPPVPSSNGSSPSFRETP
jgi:predicted RNase H-like HicB family nuclease